MKANEFVKKYGIDRAKNITVFCLGFDGDFSVWDFTISELKQIVESHELVEGYGGLEKAKLRCYPAKHLTMQSYHALRGAIADVESCQ